jgi:protein-S-isoprenylcysteine O-methyltransferase Ste14
LPIEIMLARALVAFLVMPGTVAFVVPVLLAPQPGPRADVRWLGFVPLVLGSFLLLWCVRDFYVTGKGTLAPWSPPRHLVTTGLYRWSRNPMYVAVLVILSGWALWFVSRGLAVYAVAVGIAFHLRVVLYEEPWLARTHGDAWEQYRERVPRWILPIRRAAPAGS